MQLSEQSNMTNHCWSQIPYHFSFVILDEWVVMPNNFHEIVVIDNTVTPIYHSAGKAVSMIMSLVIIMN